MKAYIAGKITGDPNYEDKFVSAGVSVRLGEIETIGVEQDSVILNPVILPKGMSNADYIKICLAMIDAADIVLFLPDWHQSRGAQLEHSYCLYIGKPVTYI